MRRKGGREVEERRQTGNRRRRFGRRRRRFEGGWKEADPGIQGKRSTCEHGSAITEVIRKRPDGKTDAGRYREEREGGKVQKDAQEAERLENKTENKWKSRVVKRMKKVGSL